MTDVLDRLGGPSFDPSEPGGAPSTDPQPVELAPAEASSPFELARPGRVMVATLAGAGSLLSFTMIQSHVAGAPLQAVALVVVAWLQVAVVVLALARPTRRLLRASIALNLVLVAAFALNHTVGLPGSATAGGSVMGGVAAALAGLAVIMSIVLLRDAGFGRGWDSTTLVLASMAPVGVLALATAAIAAPITSSSPDTVDVTAAGPSTPSPAAPAETTTTAKTPALADGESAETQPDVPLDPATQKLLGQQLALTRAAALKYPTAGDAKRAGLILAGGAAPGVGAHYQAINASALKGINPDGTVDPSSPSSWIYQGTDDDSPLAGVMYTSLAADQPEGFAGPNDHWHRHSNLCLKFADGQIEVPVAPDSDVTQQQCDALGGRFMAKTVWMVHAWVVPGWESPKGVFSHDNPNLHCPGPLNPDGSDQVDSIGLCIQQ